MKNKPRYRIYFNTNRVFIYDICRFDGLDYLESSKKTWVINADFIGHK